jgi:dTDP-4-amino-4,6-dideoxygalactose transaminase
MNPMKVFAACGEAGFVATDREDAADALRALRYNGMVDRDTCGRVSHNARLDTVQAAILLRRLERYPAKVAARRGVARFYDQALAGVVETPLADNGGESVYYTYTVLAPDRDRLRTHLSKLGIETKVQHLPLMPNQPAHRNAVGSDSPRARRLMERVLSLPASEAVSDEQRQYVAECIRTFYG